MSEDLGGICIRCNLPFSAIQKSYMTEKGEICYVCYHHKGKMYPQHCKKCNLDWFSIFESDQEFCVTCMVKGFGHLMNFQDNNK